MGDRGCETTVDCCEYGGRGQGRPCDMGGLRQGTMVGGVGECGESCSLGNAGELGIGRVGDTGNLG